jgi:hypothetical protein
MTKMPMSNEDKLRIQEQYSAACDEHIKSLDEEISQLRVDNEVYSEEITYWMKQVNKLDAELAEKIFRIIYLENENKCLQMLVDDALAELNKPKKVRTRKRIKSMRLANEKA